MKHLIAYKVMKRKKKWSNIGIPSILQKASSYRKTITKYFCIFALTNHEGVMIFFPLMKKGKN